MSKEKCEHCDYWYTIGWGDGAEKVGIETTVRIAELEEELDVTRNALIKAQEKIEELHFELIEERP